MEQRMHLRLYYNSTEEAMDTPANEGIANAFALLKEAEEKEVAQLEANRDKLDGSIESLKVAAAQVDDPVAKAVLLEQVDVLREQQISISDIIIAKQKKAIGLLSVFFG